MAKVNFGSNKQFYGGVGRRFVASATLVSADDVTTSYQATDHAEVGHLDDVSLLFDYTDADATSVQWYVEWSDDATTWYRSVSFSTSGGTVTGTINETTWTVVTAAGDEEWVDTVPVQARYMRVQYKQTAGSATGNLLTIKAHGIARG